MEINIKFLVVAYFVSLFVDWVFQWDWQAVNKSKWGNKDNWSRSWFALSSHALVYALITTFVVCWACNLWLVFGEILFTLLITHIVIDTRIPVKWIMRFKGMSWAQINDYQNFGFMHIGIDHRLHEAVLLIMAVFV